jgi:hypothetical protein
MRIRVAEFLGFSYYGATGDGAAVAPSDAHDLDVVDRCINDGYRRFLSETPLWNFLIVPLSLTFETYYSGPVASAGAATLVATARTEADDFFNGFSIQILTGTGAGQVRTVSDFVSLTHTFTVSVAWTTAPDSTSTYSVAPATCVAGENWRMYAPDDFDGVCLQPLTYRPAGPSLRIDAIGEARIRELRAGVIGTGNPVLFASRPINTGVTTTSKRWELLFWPQPGTAQTVDTVYRRFPNKLSAGTDASVAGFQHDNTVLAAALAEAEVQRGSDLGPRQKAYEMALERSRRLDQRAGARRISDYGDHSEDAFSGLNRARTVRTYNGLSVD